MKTTLVFLFILLFCGPAVAQDLPPEILADKYLLEANKAMEEGNPQRALQMFRKIEALATEKPPEFAYFYGKLLVENSTALADLRKGHTYLGQFVLTTLELLTAAGEKLGKVAAEAQRQAEAQLKAQLPQPLATLDRQMVRVAGGTFIMGCTPEQERCANDERPVHQVRVSSFALSKYEVTQEQWEAVMGENPSSFTNCPQCPVESVSWDDIQAFLRKLNEGGGRYRLPSEAEWEYAARGGQQSRGYQYAGSHSPSAVAWYGSNSGRKTHPVGQKQANELGLYDMSGNVWEWVQDCFNENYNGAPSDGSAWERGDCSRRVLRGGSWLSVPRAPRSAYRYWNTADFRGLDYGFRIARSLP